MFLDNVLNNVSNNVLNNFQIIFKTKKHKITANFLCLVF